ncbi:hypothetical protein BDR26DRAFT_349324 [Obelidium mucronatum]|nr:hypothetical protein BDR26DRAFT_349324 [Obelidium mucronatum]
MNVQHRPAPCLRCRRQKKRCDQVKPACERCVLMGKELECQYPVPRKRTPRTTRTNTTTTTLETPLDDFEDRDWTVQDPDLMASQADWLLMFTFLTTNERSGQLRLSVDVQRFPGNVFHATGGAAPNVLRVSRRTLRRRPSQEGVALSYYVRARKAVLRAPPTYQTAQAFCWIFGFSYWKGQPAVGAPFFKAALALAAALRLAVDPHALDLSESEKEERRRLYWNLYYAVKIAQSTSNDFDAVNLSVDKVNPPRAITEPYVAHISFDSFPSVCAVIDLIVVIRRHYFTGPGTLSNVLDNPGWQSVAQRLREVHGKVNLPQSSMP